VILGFVGVKMLLVDVVHLPSPVSLAVIAGVLTVTIVLSLRAERNDQGPGDQGPGDQGIAPPSLNDPMSSQS
jgi:tellurite resistance protein TerC